MSERELNKCSKCNSRHEGNGNMCGICQNKIIELLTLGILQEKNKVSDLLAACKYALPLICGERLTNDAFPPDDDLGEYLAGLFEKCEKILENAITKARSK